MFLEREHSLHHSHEMTEKVGEQDTGSSSTLSIACVLHGRRVG